MLFADVTFSTEGMVVITALLGALATVVTFLFRALIASKDSEIVARDAQIAAKDAQLLAKELKQTELKSQQASLEEMAHEAIAKLETAASRYMAAVGKPPLPALVPVVPEHNSPTTEKQRQDAERETLRARLTAATLALDLPARHPALMESPHDEAIREGLPELSEGEKIIKKLDGIAREQAKTKTRELLNQIAPAPAPVTVIPGEAIPVKIEVGASDIAKAVVEEIKKDKETPPPDEAKPALVTVVPAANALPVKVVSEQIKKQD